MSWAEFDIVVIKLTLGALGLLVIGVVSSVLRSLLDRLAPHYAHWRYQPPHMRG